MRMNKKLKNVLAFGLATSFVLTSTMGVSATGDAVSYDDVTSVEAPAPAPEGETKYLTVKYLDEAGNNIEGVADTTMSSYFEANEAADAVHTLNITDVEIPEGYELVADGQHSLVLYRDVESTGYVTVRKKAVVPEGETKYLTVKYLDEAGNNIEGVADTTMSSYFEANEAADAVHTLNITDVEIPEGYELVADGQHSLVLYRDVESTGYVTVRKKAVEEVKKTVKVVFTVDPTKGEFPGYDGSTSIHYTIDEDSEEQYLVPEVKAADGYKFVGWQVEGKESGHWDADAKTFGVTGLANYPEGSNEGYLSIDAIFEATETEPEVKKTVKVVFSVDPTKGEFPGYDGATTIHYTIDEDSAEQYLVPEVKAADGYKFVGWQVEGKESGHWDADAKTFGVTGLANYPKGSNEGYLSIDAIFEAVETETEVQKTVKVVFSVDPAKGEFPGYDGATTIHYTIDEYSEEQYLVPEVKAADGYKFVGWQVEGKESGRWDADAKTFGVTGLGFYEKGSNEGYLSIDAIFEAVETETEVQKTVKVVFSVDPAKGEFPGYDGSTTIHYTIDEYSEEQYLVPEVKAADGYKFVGWQVEGKESGRWDADAKTFGVTGLGFYEKGSNEGYLSIDAIFEAVETEAPVTEPTTETPATETPATETPTTEAPTTEAPTTEAPATEAPTTEAPTTEEPATEAPTSEPATEPTSESETKVTESETKTSEAPTTTKSDDNNSNKSADAGVKTGDTTNVMPLVITLFAAVALMVVFALRKRKVVK